MRGRTVDNSGAADAASAVYLPGRLGWVGGRYRPDAPLGAGGVSRVYHALDRLTGRPVALKLLLPGPRESWRSEHLRREGEIASFLRHRSLVRLLDRGERCRRPFLAYEFLPGGSLADALRCGSLSVVDAVRCAAEVAEGLGHMHGIGLVHADVKPGNVLFDACGRPRLIDFGLTRATGLTALQGERLVVSPRYAAPEHRACRPITPASDVYSTCAVLWLALTGLPPHLAQGELEAGEHELPRGLCEVIRTGLAADPKERFPDGAALGRALRECLRWPLPARPAGIPGRPRWVDAATEAEPGSPRCCPGIV